MEATLDGSFETPTTAMDQGEKNDEMSCNPLIDYEDQLKYVSLLASQDTQDLDVESTDMAFGLIANLLE